MSKRRIGLVIGLGIAGLMSMGAWSCGTHTDAPDPIGPNLKDATDIRVTRMPDGFRNVASGCDSRGNLVYVTSAGADDTLPSTLVVIPGGCAK